MNTAWWHVSCGTSTLGYSNSVMRFFFFMCMFEVGRKSGEWKATCVHVLSLSCLDVSMVCNTAFMWVHSYLITPVRHAECSLAFHSARMIPALKLWASLSSWLFCYQFAAGGRRFFSDTRRTSPHLWGSAIKACRLLSVCHWACARTLLHNSFQA